jgi:hypothetical protein
MNDPYLRIYGSNGTALLPKATRGILNLKVPCRLEAYYDAEAKVFALAVTDSETEGVHVSTGGQFNIGKFFRHFEIPASYC